MPKPPGDFGPRHYTGQKDPDLSPGAYTWKCPTCRSENTRPMEQGCGHCGAGTAAQAASQHALAPLTPAELAEVVLGEAAAEVAPGYWLGFEMLTPPARATIMLALASYADSAAVINPEELTRHQLRSWAQYLRDRVTADLERPMEAPAAPEETDTDG